MVELTAEEKQAVADAERGAPMTCALIRWDERAKIQGVLDELLEDDRVSTDQRETFEAVRNALEVDRG